MQVKCSTTEPHLLPSFNQLKNNFIDGLTEIFLLLIVFACMVPNIKLGLRRVIHRLELRIALSTSGCGNKLLAGKNVMLQNVMLNCI